MKYHIETDGQRIASFAHEGDRDLCLDMFEEAYPDCTFDAIEEGE